MTQSPERRPDSKEDIVGRTKYMHERFYEEHKTLASSLSVVMDSTVSTVARKMGMISAVMTLIPGAREAVLKRLHKPHDHSLAPIDPEMYEFENVVGRGYWTEVILLRSKRPDMPNLVYKSEYPETKYPIDTLVDVAKRYRGEYEDLRLGYAALPNLVPNTMYFIATSPRTGQPAVSSLQHYVGADAFDLLDTGNQEKLYELFETEAAFKKEFEDFRRITLELKKEDRGADLAGEGNILVVNAGGTHSLRLVDTNAFSSKNEHAQGLEKKKIEYLKSL